MAVRYERTGNAAVLTIDRPKRRNAIDGETATALLERFHEFTADDDARVLVVTGAGDEAFCSGADLKSLESLEPNARGGPLGFTRLLSHKPTIAAISGYAVAGGLELALWCDLRIVTTNAKFGCLERRWGVPLIDGGTQRLPRVVGQGRALDMVLTGRIVDAQEALAIGLATKVVDEGRHLEAALELAELLAGFPQETMNADRRNVIESLGRPLDEGLDLEVRIGADVLNSGLEGAQRFVGGAGRSGAGA